MKKVLNILLFLAMFTIPNVVLAAGSVKGTVPSSVENGSSVTFTVKISNTAAWNLKLIGIGATNNCSKGYADTTADANNTSKTFTLTCKATSIGAITFSVTGDITSADGVTSDVSITKKVEVVKPREKEKEARLSSLTVDGYKIDFSKDKDVYSVSVEPSVDSINISAKALSSKASITGTGKKTLSASGGKFEVVCTAEDGTQKIYVINVSVVDNNPIKIKIDDVDYVVVKSITELQGPSNTKEEKTKIQGFDIPSYINEQSNLTIIGIKDDSGNIKYAIYNNGEYKLYNENKSSDLLLYISHKELHGYNATTVIINEKEYNAYDLNNRFKIIYAMNLENGEYNYYKYDTKEKTFQYFELEQEEKNEKRSFNIFIVTTILFIITSLCLLIYVKRLKKRRNLKKLDLGADEVESIENISN